MLLIATFRQPDGSSPLQIRRGTSSTTRNMATGASTADAAVVLIDARKGALVQSRRHAYIASLLRVRTIIVAVEQDGSRGV